MLRTFRIAITFLLLGVPSLGLATQPLANPFQIGEHSGVLYPSQCCWVEIPRTEALMAMGRADRCTAIGGPVGRFEVSGGRLWLTGLYTCAGDVPLQEVYPQMQGPVVATWLDGEFKALVGDRCLSPSYKVVNRYVVRLKVVSGIVTGSHIEPNEEFVCQGAVVPDPVRRSVPRSTT